MLNVRNVRVLFDRGLRHHDFQRCIFKKNQLIFARYSGSGHEIGKGFPKDKSGDIYLHPDIKMPAPGPKTVEDFSNPSKNPNWHSYGYDYTSQQADRFYLHTSTFEVIVLLLMVSHYLYYYGPDYRLREWARREAYLQMHKREMLGLPYIDKDFVDPERIALPSDEEIGDFAIII